MKKATLSFTLLASVLLFGSCMNSGSPGNSSDTQLKINAPAEDDMKFVKDAADGGMFEVMMGKYALEHATDPDVKMLGQHMFEDHSKANEELKVLAQKKGIELPTAVSDKHAKVYNDMMKKSGRDFDKAYSDQMVDDHKADIPKFEAEGKKGTDPDIRSWAAGKVDVLKGHLQMAQNTVDALKDKKDEKDLEHKKDMDGHNGK
ncbi:MAG TPA: DUF4142 domain-containing protein [Bacteroidia bacterium]|jgi:putative membrane protein